MTFWQSIYILALSAYLKTITYPDAMTAHKFAKQIADGAVKDGK